MHAPYTDKPLEAFMAAHTACGLVVASLLASRPLRPRAATALFAAAIAVLVVLPVDAEMLGGLGVTLGPLHYVHGLESAAALASLAALLTRRPRLAVVALLGQAALWKLTGYLQEFWLELASAHLALLGLLLGLHERGSQDAPPAPDRPPEGPGRPWLDDLAAFGLATAAGGVVCRVVLLGRAHGADEGAYTFQAALFAKLHAYGSIPSCSLPLRTFWVFEHLGRRFAQYTPGWPYFMAPFVAARMPWLAAPASFGALAAGVSRLGRRAASGHAPGALAPSLRHVRAAGRLAALAVGTSATVLINAGSRYSHVLVAATFAWTLEALCIVAGAPDETPSRRRQVAWGAGLGVGAALLLSTRVADGATLGLGLFAYFVHALARRRIGWRAVAASATAFAVVGGMTLFILRLQIGRWWTTGYSLSGSFYSFAAAAWSLPKPDEYRAGFPLASGAYCWWPCSIAVGLAGLAALQGRARRLGFVMLLSYFGLLTLYTLSEFGRGGDFGYGPRYELPLVVPMAIGTGVALGRLWARATQPGLLGPEVSALRAGGPIAVALVASVVGVVRIAPLLYPYAHADVVAHNQLQLALERTPVHHAVVLGGADISNTSALDLPENLPIDLYPDQDVLITNDQSPETIACFREHYRDRALYVAVPGDPVTIEPVP